jgi:hypothetical protein
MKIYHSGRATGKTTKLIMEAADKRFYIVCSTLKESARIHDQAEQMGLHIPVPITYAEFINGRFRGEAISGFLIDNADFLLGILARGVPVHSMTLTMDDSDQIARPELVEEQPQQPEQPCQTKN